MFLGAQTHPCVSYSVYFCGRAGWTSCHRECLSTTSELFTKWPFKKRFVMYLVHSSSPWGRPEWMREHSMRQCSLFCFPLFVLAFQTLLGCCVWVHAQCLRGPTWPSSPRSGPLVDIPRQVLFSYPWIQTSFFSLPRNLLKDLRLFLCIL